MRKGVADFLHTFYNLVSFGAVLSVLVVPLVFLSAPPEATLDQMARVALCFLVVIYLQVRLVAELLIGAVESFLKKSSLGELPTPSERVPFLVSAALVVSLLSIPCFTASLVCIPVYWVMGVSWGVRAAAWGLLVFVLLFVVAALVVFVAVGAKNQRIAIAQRIGTFLMHRLEALLGNPRLHHRPA